MPLLAVKNISKVFKTGDVSTRAVDGVSFNVEEGEFVAIRGPSGSGKSTLLHMLGFLDNNTGGEYLFDGKSINDLSGDDLAHVRNAEMGFVFQAFNLIPLATVYENVQLPLLYSSIAESEWDKRTRAAVDSVGLTNRIGQLANKLSGGEKQRAAIARALILKPQIIFADEPTGNLDSKSGASIMEILSDLNKNYGHTILLITHDDKSAGYAERIIHLRDGKLKADERQKATAQ